MTARAHNMAPRSATQIRWAWWRACTYSYSQLFVRASPKAQSPTDDSSQDSEEGLDQHAAPLRLLHDNHCDGVHHKPVRELAIQ